MANPFDWSAIAGGEVFQALVNTLILFEEPTARTFIRPGKDGAQDARSADGTRIWQAKHHEVPTIGKTVADALAELKKIKDYRDPSNEHFQLWKDASDWILVTNTTMNAASYRRWDLEVVPKFKAIKLDAKLWPKEKIESLLTKFPHVAAAYFRGQNRCFISLREAFNQAEGDAISARGLQIKFEGRKVESRKISEFLSGPKKLVCIHGPGGIGKSRLLLEVGEKASTQGFEVLWGQEATLAATTDWFSAVVPERQTVLLLDEPKDPRLLDIISEQIAPAGRMKSWKIVISVRSPKDPVLKTVQAMSDSLREEFIELKPLSKEEAESAARQLIEKSTLRDLAKEQKEQASSIISAAGNHYPVWIVMAVRVLEKDRNLSKLPSSANDIAAKYVQEVIDYSPPELATKNQIHGVMRWLAVYEELNVENVSLLAFIASETDLSTDVRLHECLNSLVQRKFAVRRGIGGRLYSIRPDVVREFIVREWLTQKTDSGYETTPSARRLIQLLLQNDSKTPLPNSQQLLKSLATLEFSERLQEHVVDVLGPIIDGLTQLTVNGTLRDQQIVIGHLFNIAFARVLDVLAIVRTVKNTSKEPFEVANPLFGKTELTHDKIIADLPWLLFEVAHYAASSEERMAILTEVMDLFQREFGSEERNWNDGKRARDLIPRIIRGGQNFRTGFWEDGFHVASDLVAKVKSGDVAADNEIALMKTFCEPFLSLERERTDFSKNVFTFRRWLVRPNSKEGIKRNKLRDLIRGLILDSALSLKVRRSAWQLLADAHSSANRAVIGEQRQEMQTFVAEVREDLRNDLAWTLDILQKSELEISELKAARALWDWHHRFEKEPTLKNLADQCEELYQKHPLAAAFHTLFSHETYKEAQEKALELGNEYGAKKNDAEMFRLIHDAAEFAAKNSDWSNIAVVFDQIGIYWDRNPNIEVFVREALGQESSGYPFQFAARILTAKLREIRKAEDDDSLEKFLKTWLHVPRDRDARETLLLLLYGRPHPLITGVLREADLDAILLSLGGEKDGAEKSGLADPIKLRLLTAVHHIDWPRFQAAAERIWEGCTEGKAQALAVLVDGMEFLDLFRTDYPILQLTAVHYDWLLKLLVNLPDIEEFSGHSEWVMSELAVRFGKKSVQLLLETIETRLALTSTSGEEAANTFRPIPTGHKLLQYVKPIDVAGPPSEEGTRTVNRLLGYSSRTDMLGYMLPEYAVTIDPRGVIVPNAVASELDSLAGATKDELRNWSRFAGYYPFNSEPWRKIAVSAISAADKLSLRDKTWIYVSLLDQGIKSSSFSAGEMDPRFAKDLELRRKERAEEPDPRLFPFRDWHLRVAQSEYDQALGEFRGEIEDE